MSSNPSPGLVPRRALGLRRVRIGRTSDRFDTPALFRVVLGIAACLLFGGCGDEGASGTTGGSTLGSACSDRVVRMGVAASLREVGEALTDDLAAAIPPIKVETSFGASSVLARQVELGAPIDLLVSADEDLMDSLVARNSVVSDSVQPIAEGRLVLATLSGSPFESLGLGSLRSPRLKRIGLPSQAVPLGRYGRAWLEALGVFDDLHGKVVATENARANLTALAQGHVDLAILYETDFLLKPELSIVFRPDPKDYPAIRYVAARTTRASKCSNIDRVLEAWRSSRTRAHLAAAGFGLLAEPSPIAARVDVQADANAFEPDRR